VHPRLSLGEGLVERGSRLLQVGDACVPQLFIGSDRIKA
jgi:hypothetical protein